MTLDDRSDDADGSIFQRLLDIWNGAPIDSIALIVTDDYRGHMLHLAAGERDASGYVAWIRDYRAANPTARFEVVDQFVAGDRVITRVRAMTSTTALGSEIANGINISRLGPDGRIAEEWAIWSAWFTSEEGD